MRLGDDALGQGVEIERTLRQGQDRVGWPHQEQRRGADHAQPGRLAGIRPHRQLEAGRGSTVERDREQREAVLALCSEQDLGLAHADAALDRRRRTAGRWSTASSRSTAARRAVASALVALAANGDSGRSVTASR